MSDFSGPLPPFPAHTDAIFACQGCDLSGLLSFDLESIEPASSAAPTARQPHVALPQLQRLRVLLSSPIETLVDDPEEVKNILGEIQHQLPMTLQVKLWPAATLSFYKPRLQLARQRIELRRAQLPLKAGIEEKCHQLNEKKAAFDAKTDTTASVSKLESLRKELEDLEEKARATRQRIHDEEASIARSKEEAEVLKTQLKADLAELRALNKQLVTGEDKDDEAEIAEVDRVRTNALSALESFLQ